jgi:hypothetical protein
VLLCKKDELSDYCRLGYKKTIFVHLNIYGIDGASIGICVDLRLSAGSHGGNPLVCESFNNNSYIDMGLGSICK